MGKDIREYLERCVERLEVKRRSLDEAIRALHTLRDQSSVIGDELAEIMTEAVVRKVTKETSLFTQINQQDSNDPGDTTSEIIRDSSKFKGKNYVRVLRFFLERNNEYATNMEIRRACGITRGSVAVVLYTTHADFFERKPLAQDDKKKVIWRLSEAGMARARELSVTSK